jgi:hypothetical protein
MSKHLRHCLPLIFFNAACCRWATRSLDFLRECDLEDGIMRAVGRYNLGRTANRGFATPSLWVILHARSRPRVFPVFDSAYRRVAASLLARSLCVESPEPTYRSYG